MKRVTERDSVGMHAMYMSYDVRLEGPIQTELAPREEASRTGQRSDVQAPQWHEGDQIECGTQAVTASRYRFRSHPCRLLPVTLWADLDFCPYARESQ